MSSNSTGDQQDAPENLSRVRGSKTAELVAVCRARHLLRHDPPHIFEDRFAFDMLGPAWSTILRYRLIDFLVVRCALRKLIPMTIQALTRARYAEDIVEEAVGRGTRQFVLLGAGYDTFALRHPDLDVTVFEVDLQASADLKRERLAKAGHAIPTNVRFAPCDFEEGALERSLDEAGFDRTKPAAFVWMGVTYYLARESVLETLAALSRLAAPSSDLVLDYLIADSEVAEEDREGFRRLMDFVGKRGEPMRTRYVPSEIQAELALGDDWEVLGNLTPRDQRERFGLDDRDDIPKPATITCFLHLRRR